MGDVDGLKEAQNNDITTGLYYDLNNASKEILQKQNYIICGKKGCGKTFLAQYLKRQSDTSNNKRKKFEILPAIKEFQLRKKIEDNYNCILTSEDLSIFWEWVIYYELSKLLLNLSTNSIIDYIKNIRFNINKRRLKKYIKDIDKWDSPVDKMMEILLENTTSNNTSREIAVTKTPINISYRNNKTNKNSIKYCRNNYYSLLKDLKNKFGNALSAKDNITICYDEIDDIIDTNLYTNLFYRNIIISLLRTAANINNHTIYNDNIKIIVLIRNDILNLIHSTSSNSNKLSDSCINMNWQSNKEDFNHPLIDMILSKIKSTNIILNDYDNATLYKKYFNDKVDNKSPAAYLISMGLGRPREIIKHLNLIKKAFPDADSFKYKHYRNVKLSYSEWFYNELKNEMALHYDAIYIDQSFSLLKNFSKRSFRYNEICNYYKKNKKHYSSIKDMRTYVDMLFEFNIIGNKYIKNRNKKFISLRYRWKYKNGVIKFDEIFVVHIALRSILNI